MSRNQYLKQLERLNDAAQKTIDDLTRENYELRTLLKEAQPHAVRTPDGHRPQLG